MTVPRVKCNCRFKAEEKEVFPTPSTIQKKDLLHQKLIQKEQDLRQAQDKLRAADRQIKGEDATWDIIQ